MAVNRYDSPAQARFMNTYVPIPFEQLYTLGKQAKADVDKAMTDLSSTLDKWSDFRSPSERDTQTWYNETLGKARPIVERLSSNLDLLKSPEGKSQIYSLINNVDRAKLSTLQQSREGLATRQKVNQQLMLSGKYNPLWHDVDFANYDTMNEGIYNDLSPLAYSSVKDLTNQYVDSLKDSYLGTSGGFIRTGVTGDQIKGILDANRSGILSTPEAQKHMQVYMQQNPGSTQEEAAQRLMQRAYTDNQEYIRENISVDPYAMQALKYKQALDTANARKKSSTKEDPSTFPDAYKRLYNDAIVQEQRMLTNNSAFGRTRNITNGLEQAQAELRNMALGLQNGTVSVESYNMAAQTYMDYENQLRQTGELGNALADDVADMFASKSNIFPKTGVRSEDLPLYYNTSSRVLNDITYPVSGQILGAYNKVSNSNEIEINSGDVTMKGYSAPDTKGSILATDFVNKMMKVAPMNYMVETTNGLERNFAEDLKAGTFENVIKVPRNRIVATEIDGVNQLAQRVSLKIPMQSIKNAGYNERQFRKMAENALGLTSETGLTVNPVDGDKIKDAWGSVKSGKSRGGAALSGEYFTIDVMEPIDPHGMTRMTFDQEVNDIHGGSKLQNDQYDSSFSDSYQDIINSLLQ